MLRVRVAALCIHAGQVLLARHVSGKHVAHLLPGGGVEPGESAAAALRREVREEAGVDCDVGVFRYVVETRAPSGARHVVQLVFEAALRGPVGASLDARVAECAWHPLEDLRRLALYPDAGAEIAGDLERGAAGCRYVLAPWRA
jgi:8-oxo-dGTP pyrophosphatase MutT (NUDIX family)